MHDRLESLEAEVATLRRELEALRGRMASLEQGAASRATAARRQEIEPPRAADAQHPEHPTYGTFAQSIAPLAGRMLLVLAGAFVLRALTDAGTVPAAVGVTLGFAYAAGVLVLAARAAGSVGAGFHGLTAVLMVFPLLHEATARFRLLGPPAAALLLAALSAAVVGVMAWRRLHGVAWVGTGVAILTGSGLMLATGRLVPVTLALVGLGLLTLWIGERVGWNALRWPPALAADLAVAVVLGRAAGPDPAEGPALAVLAAALLVVGYLGSFAARTLYLGRNVGIFEAAQTAALLVLGLGGTAFLASRSGGGTAALGWGTLALAAGSYAVAFAFVERRQRGSANFPFYASVALAFALAGAWLALPEPVHGPALGALALAAAVMARLSGRRTLALHAAAYALFAAGAADLLGHATSTVFSSEPEWAALPPFSLAVLTVLAAAALVAAGSGPRASPLERGPQLALDLVVAISAAGVVAGWAGAALARAAPADPGAVGTARSAVLAGGAILAAWLGRREAGREAGWLAWPLVALLGLKLAFEDFPRGRPATLILSLAFAGAALILVPRLRTRPAGDAPPAASSPGAA